MTCIYSRGAALVVAIAMVAAAGCTAKHQTRSTDTQAAPRHTDDSVLLGNGADEGDAVLPIDREQAVAEIVED